MYIKNNLLPLFIPFQAVHTASVALQTYESKKFKKHTKQILETGFLFENQSFNGHIYMKSTPKYNWNSYFVMTLHNITSGVILGKFDKSTWSSASNPSLLMKGSVTW